MSESDGRMVAATVPATLLQAVPSGALDAVASSTTGAARRAFSRARSAAVACTGGSDDSIDPSFDPPHISFELKGAWSLFHGLTSASLTASAGSDASLSVTLGASGSCTLNPKRLLSIDGPTVDTFVGPVPVVMTSDITVDLAGSAHTQGDVTTDASVGFSAKAGIGWTKDAGFHPIQSFTPHLNYSPPSLSVDAGVSADLIPTLHVLLYGVAGPQLALKAGLAFNADLTENPWWSLTAPVDLTGSLSIPPLHLTSPSLTLYKHTFPIADAGGPFPGTTNPGGPGSVALSDPGPQTGTIGVPIALQISASDSDERPLTYSASGLPIGLSINATTGLITGTPLSAGTTAATVTATDPASHTASVSFSWTVSPADTPPNPGASSWSLTLPGSAALVSAPGNRLIATTCSQDGSSASVESIADTGAVQWTAPLPASECATPLDGDLSGATYIDATDRYDASGSLASYSANGSLQWSTPLLGEVDATAFDSAGNIYVDVFDSSKFVVEQINTTTGMVENRFSAGDGTGGFLSSFHGGLVVGGATALYYYGFNGNLEATYNVPNPPQNTLPEYAAGANGEVLVGTDSIIGPDGQCSPSVTAFDPQGVSWRWTGQAEPANCGPAAVASTPDGGAVLTDSEAEGPNGNGTPVFYGIGSGGSLLWSSPGYVPSSTNDSAQTPAPQYQALADSYGTVAAPTFYTFPFGDELGQDFAFVSERDGAPVAPLLVDPGYGFSSQTYSNVFSWTLGGGYLFVVTDTANGSDAQMDLAAYPEAVGTAYPLELQEETEAGQ